MKKNSEIHVRVSDTQRERIERLAQQRGQTISEYARGTLLNRKDVGLSHQDLVAIKNLTYEINKIGTNVNQIVHNNNSDLYSNQDKIRLTEDMQLIQKLLRECTSKIRNQ